ncbi:MAG: FtsX-like permease family protein [Ktedonobacteraceae bacterium]|nr:FtsX-like permease family protein [Ktedonobacteraceae bacterium]
MWRYVFLLLRRQPGKSVLASSGFLLAACALILLSATTQTTVVQANQIISQSWRPTYDLVVLPAKARIPRGQSVPADFLQSYDGGISMQQYAQIKQLAGVEVAAPIAYVGYISMPTPTVYFPSRQLLTGFYRLSWTVTAFNGQRQIVEYREDGIYYLSPCYGIGAYNFHTLDDVLQNGIPNPVSECPGTPGTTSAAPVLSVGTPQLGTFLLAAVDPEAEDQLVHLDKSLVHGRMLTTRDTVHLEKRIQLQFLNQQRQHIPIEAIPMLIHQNLPGQITLTGQLTQLAPEGAVSVDQLRKQGGANYLLHRQGQKAVFDGTVPMVQNDPDRFANAQLAWDGHAWQRLAAPPSTYIFGNNGYVLNFAGATTPTGLTYRPVTAPDGRPAYSLLPSSAQGSEAGFRPLKPLQTIQKPLQDVVYTFDSVGQFANDSIVSQFSNPLNWLPENTYALPPEVLRYDAQGHIVKPATLLPTTNPAGFVTQPPLALTTLAAAQQLKGDTIISAIRVRVAGVDRVNQQSWKRVEQVAGLITQRTHLQVVVTLGSSPSPTLVYVPGIKQGQFGSRQDIAPVGWVEERWITIGVSLLYLAQLGATRVLLLGAVLAVCLGYLVVAFSALATAQRREFAVLSALGWRPWHIARLFLGQALLFALGGGLVGLLLALLIVTLLEAVPIWLIVIWTLPVMLVMALATSLYPLWSIWRIRPGEILRAGSAIASGRAPLLGLRLWSFVPPISALVVRNLTRSRPRAMITIASLFLSAALLVLMLSSILALHQTLTSTLLGDFVLLQTAVPQIAGCVFAVLLSFLSVADLLLLQVRERRQEIGLLQAIGWRPGLVQRLFVQEGLVLALLSAVPGALAAQVLLTLQHTSQQIIPVPLVLLGAVLLLLLMAALATIPALRVLQRMPAVDALRAE